MRPFEYSPEWYEVAYHTDLYHLPEATPAAVMAEWALAAYHERLREAWTLLPEPLAGDVLELGASYGRCATWMLAEFPTIERLWAVDWSRVAVAFCRRLGTERLIPFHGDAARLPFADGFIDAVSCVDFTEHLPADVYLAVLAEFSRVARDGALLVLYQGTAKRPEHIHVIPDAELLADCASSGWALVASTSRGYHILRRCGQ